MKITLPITYYAVLLSIAFCFVPVVRSAEKAKSSLSRADKQFVEKAYQGGLTEIANAKMAKEKAQSEATRKVAERMITDHSKVNEGLMRIAKEENLDLSRIHATSMTMSGDSFDKEYLSMLQKVHQKDIAMFEQEAKDTRTGEDRDVPVFAKKTLPELKHHLSMINGALAKMK